MLQDIRFAVRTLIKNPAFTVAAVVCLALGIGVNATIFSCVRATLLRPFPYRDPDQLMAIGESNPTRGWHMNSVSYPNFRSWQADNRTFESVGVYSGASFNLAKDDGADYVPGANVSWTMFHTLGVAPALGRDFHEDEDRVGSPRVIILGDRLWRTRFDGRRDVLGQDVMVNGVPYQVIGVMPPGFEFPETAGAWTTMRSDPNQSRGNHSWRVIGRLKPGTSVEQARTDLQGIAARLAAQFPRSNTGWSVDIETVREYATQNLRTVMLLMMASVGFVLLIACANVANLLLARTASRAREIAVRVALGADRWRIVRQLLTESVIVALVGASLGIAMALAFLQWIKASILGGIPFWMQFTVDGQVLLFTGAVAIGTAFLFGLAPAVQAARPNLNETLRDAGARGSTSGRSRQRLRGALVIGEIALSLVLLTGATLLIRSFVGMQRVQPGFDSSHLLTMRVTLTGPSYDSTYKRFAFFDQFLARLNAQPGIISASIANNIPLSGNNNNNFFNAEGQDMPLGAEPLLEVRWVSPRYLETLRVPLVAGRMFSQQEWADSTAGGRVVVVNQYMARKFWKSAQEAIGKRITFGNATDSTRQWITVVGVAADIKDKDLAGEPDLQGYMPYRQGGWNTATIVVRTAGDPAAASHSVLSVLKESDPRLPVYRVMSMDANISQSYWQQALYGKLFGVFALIALVLAAVGVYGVIAYTVSQRTQELGVRVALGAQGGDVMRLVVGHGALLGAVGIGIGLGGALVVTRFLRTLLFGVSPFDPASFVGVSLVLGGIVLLASYIPARKAMGIDPVEALRAE
ncbi:MAG TPA: ABC transporter permease [Gemmatimonadaceae bacterium]|nr:ABC transporter permease [Gemmatimonadaceae bacterium]